ncbi:YesL family protein [Blautia sp. MSJ-19]|uniref:YesL family protein n=1 Tax=Blautia sp. MSJ-19 TaxID=2841517 RepID=UPI001C0F0515|nr:DUF624 domain-containing protein [Blautia sp. MSJ-19]MBU5482597.1 DUF624 domain-containing protein [Blautia sp. MSJ-19]
MKFNTESPVFQFLETLFDFVILNVLFLITCIPVVTIGPAISALYTVTLREVRNEQGYIIRSYFAAFKENFKHSFLLSVLYTIVGAILLYNLAFWAQMKTAVGSAFLIIIAACTLLYVISLLYVFALSARFENTIKRTVKNSLLIALASPVQTLMILLIAVIGFALTSVSPLFRVFLVIFGFAFLAYCASFPLTKVFSKYENDLPGKTSDFECLKDCGNNP